MDPPLINEASFSVANPAAYSLAGIWPFPVSGGGCGGGREFGLRNGQNGGFGHYPNGCLVGVQGSVEESSVTEQSGSKGGGGGRKRKDGGFENENDGYKVVCTNSDNDLNEYSDNGLNENDNCKLVFTCSDNDGFFYVHFELLCENENYKLVSICSDNDLTDLNGKQMKVSGPKDDSSGAKVEAESSSKTGSKATEQNSKAEPPKDYIHVRARRGQATDSHSLAERARREKISERMKILQDLVPGCNKVIGKALVLDEIINYIQSLQHQVELEAVNSKMRHTIEGFPPKELVNHAFDATGMMFGSQPPRECVQGSQPEWLHMQLGSSYEGAG
ncbi:hypothetical protein Leryth_013066 [Lithospermum erythrorhizon]|nr:hypothetical protein Leryth_013066 [Lithospermum erythrorhizon]